MTLEYMLDKAKEAVKNAGAIIRTKFYTRDFKITYKKDGSPVTTVDKAAELKIRSVLLDAFSHHSFCGEEYEPIIGSSGFTWYCDPIDGTWCFINGETTASTSLALSDKTKTILAVVYNPFTDELYSGAIGIPTTLNDTPLPFFNNETLSQAVCNVQISPKRKEDMMHIFSLWEQKKIGKVVSTGGSVAYNLAQVAKGNHSVYIASSTKPAQEWDIAAGIYLVRSVGGRVSLLDDNTKLVAATNPHIHEQTLELLIKKAR